jgi:DNA-binding transcriptional ArsR family regulator
MSLRALIERLAIVREICNVREMSDVLAGHSQDYELADRVRADTPERMKALGDPLRGAILDLVLERAMTVTELAGRLRRPKGSVAYHVKVLLDAGLLQVVRTQKVRAIEERYYGRTGRSIVFEDTPGEVPFLRLVLAEIDLEEPAQAVGFTYRRARIPHARAEEYMERLLEITFDFIDEPRAGDVEFGLYVGMFPTNRRLGPPPDADHDSDHQGDDQDDDHDDDEVS